MCLYYYHQISSVPSLVSLVLFVFHRLLWPASPFCMLSWSTYIILFYHHLCFFWVSTSLSCLLFCHVCCNDHGKCFTNPCVIPYSTSLSSSPSNQERMVVPHRGCFLINWVHTQGTTTSHISCVLNMGIYIDTHFFLLGHSMAMQYRDLFQKIIANFPTSQNFPNSYSLRIQSHP